MQHTDNQRAAIWLRYRRLNRFVMLITVAGWSAIWELAGGSPQMPTPICSIFRLPHGFGLLALWLPPILGLGLYLLLCFSTDKAVFNLRWSAVDIVRQAWWRTASFVVPLLMVVTAFDDIFDGKARGIVWLAGAGLAAKIGTIFFHQAEGMKLHEARSGETRNRALSIARKMGASIDRVFIVPAGKGHLTNAFAGSGAIGVTDNLGKYFTRAQGEYVIAHEVAHVKHRDSFRTLQFAVISFSILALFTFFVRYFVGAFRPLLDMMVLILPVTAFYYLSRRMEYAADREAVNFTGDPETAIRALAKLYQVSEVPIRCSRFTELFLTHPAFMRRVQAIARVGQLPDERVNDILRNAQ